ncbi:TPA: hypothetical protein ACGR77_002677 [Pseudomonas aeruginosa]|uniref:hypothetical protein n=1 Tax=Pseudomonas sp. FSL R10-2398 TaxID=2662201 RepID=UPI00129567A7|nr:hypothetical protein [Pseudomonas sp. FSL R10-2398]MQT50883.1 hypothetical protein [Pseudomonas sp. FSL R10-2398]
MNRNILNSKIYNKEHQRIVDSEIKKACALNSITESELREFALDTPLAPVIKFGLYVVFAVVLMTFADGRHEQAFWIWSTAMIFALAWRYHVLKASIRFFMSKDNRQTYKAVKSTLRALQKTLKPINKQQAKAEDAHTKRSKRGVVVASVNEAVEKRIKAEREASTARSAARSGASKGKDTGSDCLVPGSPASMRVADDSVLSSPFGSSGSSDSSSSGDSSFSSGGDGGGGD